MAELAYALGELIGLSGNTLADLHLAAHLHNIGKIGILDGVLNKTSSLLKEVQNESADNGGSNNFFSRNYDLEYFTGDQKRIRLRLLFRRMLFQKTEQVYIE